jgi:PAS domain-containing protein
MLSFSSIIPEAAFDAIPSPLLVLDPELKVVAMNQAAREAAGELCNDIQQSLGVSAAELVGTRLVGRITELQSLQRILQDKRQLPWSFEVEVGAAWLEGKINALGEEGFIVSVENATERIQELQRLRQAARQTDRELSSQPSALVVLKKLKASTHTDSL